ncbi:Tigger transposable element-derived protein 1-like 113 [Homarus americanus]|uniref:Tigger transposable element-derived protein 1-like 113 n=1 Tax=Homarus americanus TaxID=6706 RepID=A0A8J5NEX6_HOMAM|nr:Tigger transposable element-derived protein 1-like 113 [Homarus americanus]
MSKWPATTSLTTPKAKKSRQAITLEQKIKVLEALQRGNGASSVGRQFGLSESSVCTIKLNEKKIRATYASPDVAKATFWKSYTIKDAITNITLAWKSVPETELNGVWRNLWPEVVHDFKGFDEGKDVKDILRLVKEVRGDSKFQEIQEEDVNELLFSMEDPLTSEKVLEMHITSATQSALQHDPDMERGMQVVEALNRAASTYSQLLDQMVMAQQQKKIASIFRPLSSSTPGVAGLSTSGQTRPSSSASCMSDASTATPLDSDVDVELVE